MSKRALLWTGLGLLAAGAVGWGIAGRGGAPAVGDVPEAVEEGAVAGLTAHPAVAGPPPTPVPMLPRGVTGPLLVRVTAAYEPKAGVSVRVRRVDNLHPRAAVTTDARGLARLPAVDRGVDVVEAIAEGFRPTSTEREGFQETDGALELTLEPGTPVAGRVVDAATGEGLEGASVVVRLASYAYEIGVVGPSGRFTIPGLWDGADGEVAATAPGHAPARASVALVAGGGPPPEPVLRMGLGGAFVGVVRTAGGAPVSGAEVALIQRPRPRPPPPESVPTSDGRPFADSVDRYFGDDVWTPTEAPDAESGPTHSDGTFRVDGLEPGTDYEVIPRGTGLLSAGSTWIRTSAAGDAGPAALVVLRAGTVRLRVTAPAHDPLPSYARVRLFYGDAMSSPAGAPIDGEFRFENVRPGPAVAVVQAYGFESALLRATLAEGEETRLTLAVVPVPGVSGVVVDAAGRPLVEAYVFATPAGSEAGKEASAASDANGRFEIRHPPAKDVDLRATWRSAAAESRVAWTKEPVRVRAPRSDVRLVLAPRGLIRLRVPTGGDSALTVIRRADHRGLDFIDFPEDGVFERGDLDDGAYEVLVYAPDFAWMMREVVIEGGGTTDLGDVSLPVGVSVTGRILDGQGRPVDHALVRPAMFESGRPEPFPGDTGTRAFTDARGVFTLEHLPAGRNVKIEASATGHSSRWGEVVAGSGTPFELRLQRLARIGGSLRGPDGTDFKELAIYLSGSFGPHLRGGVMVEAGTETVALEPSEAGTFSKFLRPGDWTAVFTDSAGEDHVLGSWTLAEGAEVDVVLRLPGS